MDHEVWDSKSGNMIFSTEDYDEAFKWLWDLVQAQGEDVLDGLSLNVTKSDKDLVIIVKDDVLKYVLADMSPSGPDVKRDEDATS